MITPIFGMGALEGELWRLLFAMTRIGAALLAAPLFGGVSVPAQARVIVTGAVAVLVCAWVPFAPPPPFLSVAGMLAIGGEVLVGLALGFVLQLSFAAPLVAAEVIGGTMGMSMASTVDPHSGAHSPALGQYYTIILTLVFLALGAHLQWFALLVESYRVLPPGAAWLAPDRVRDIAGLGAELFATALVIALPVTFVLMVVQLVTGVLSRSAPALNLFALGLPAGVLAGLAALIASAPLVTDQMVLLSADAIDAARMVIAR